MKERARERSRERGEGASWEGAVGPGGLVLHNRGPQWVVRTCFASFACAELLCTD